MKELSDGRSAVGTEEKQISRFEKKVKTLLKIAAAFSELSTCVGTKVGAILTDSNFCILSSGYNGVPSGFPHCEDIQTKEDHDHSFELHAETNCIARADNTHVYGDGGLKLFCTHLPCIHCAKLIVAGLSRLPIREIYISWIYNTKDPKGVKADSVISFLGKAGITVWIRYQDELVMFEETSTPKLVKEIERYQAGVAGWGNIIRRAAQRYFPSCS